MMASYLRDLHPDDVPLWLSVETAVWRLALAAKLKLREVKPMPTRFLITHQGCCLAHPANEIWISLRRSPGKHAERYSEHQLLDTIAHEVAHLKAGVRAQHRDGFFRAFSEMLVLACDINIRFDIQASGVNLEP